MNPNWTDHCTAWLAWVRLEHEIGREATRAQALAEPDAGSEGYLVASAGRHPDAIEKPPKTTDEP